jgi:hypothetical protein
MGRKRLLCLWRSSAPKEGQSHAVGPATYWFEHPLVTSAIAGDDANVAPAKRVYFTGASGLRLRCLYQHLQGASEVLRMRQGLELASAALRPFRKLLLCLRNPGNDLRQKLRL